MIPFERSSLSETDGEYGRLQREVRAFVGLSGANS
jgi:hypothetical protein